MLCCGGIVEDVGEGIFVFGLVGGGKDFGGGRDGGGGDVERRLAVVDFRAFLKHFVEVDRFYVVPHEVEDFVADCHVHERHRLVLRALSPRGFFLVVDFRRFLKDVVQVNGADLFLDFLAFFVVLEIEDAVLGNALLHDVAENRNQNEFADDHHRPEQNRREQLDSENCSGACRGKMPAQALHRDEGEKRDYRKRENHAVFDFPFAPNHLKRRDEKKRRYEKRAYSVCARKHSPEPVERVVVRRAVPAEIDCDEKKRDEKNGGEREKRRSERRRFFDFP